MKNIILTISLLVLSILYWPASSPAKQDFNTLFEEANSAYSTGDFRAAAGIYEKLTKTDGFRAGVLYNLANSYAQLGQPGNAVLNYERALRISPGNSDIAGNLKLVKNHHGLFEQEKTITEKLTHLLTMNQWIALSTSLFGFCVLLLMSSCRFTQLRRTLAPIGMCSFILVAAALYAACELYEEWNGSVVISPQIRLVISPFEGAASIGDIKEGRMVFHLGRDHGDYSYVEDATGRQGWIVNSAVKPVIP